ncbi:amino acid ABC transporter permease [Mesorhizobium loti]|uniref:amino acid ABC transporter permease n=1 Tax=Rhizobium loti TaxID=381 RepID=UPI0009E51F8B|nr:amino acid ABC transporter permease [Mesorhizobium loti]
MSFAGSDITGARGQPVKQGRSALQKTDPREFPNRIILNNPTPVPHPGRWIAVGLLCIAAMLVLWSLATNPNFHWDVVRSYLFDQQVLRGILWTLVITVMAMVVAIVAAVSLTFMRDSENPVLRFVSWLWVWLFRGTPVYTQLVFWGLLSVLYPRISVTVPFGPQLFSLETIDVFTPGVSAVLGLGFNEAAYLAEIFRAGFRSVDSGQKEAAKSIGMGKTMTMFRIILPQAMRMIIPPTGNETIGMLKTTSLVLAVPFAFDLTFATNTIANRLYLPIPLLIVSGLWYLAITSILMVGQHFLEQHFGKGVDVAAIHQE